MDHVELASNALRIASKLADTGITGWDVDNDVQNQRHGKVVLRGRSAIVSIRCNEYSGNEYGPAGAVVELKGQTLAGDEFAYWYGTQQAQDFNTMKGAYRKVAAEVGVRIDNRKAAELAAQQSRIDTAKETLGL
ncbi:MAG: hypothetical protein WAL84_06890 [Candidatus Dormiibacterota bacterium]